MQTTDLFTAQPLYRTPAEVLKKVFGYTSFRPLQQNIICAVLAHHDTLAVMPTGGGKSLCYQIPALLLPGLTIVVSPLISLMQDQVDALQTAGVDALLLNSALEWNLYRQNMDRVRSGSVKLLYVAPESLFTPRIQELLLQVQVSCITIDEAHCISEWGHDFRPEYRKIAQIRSLFPDAVCLALTATATATVRKDIVKNLNLLKPQIVIAGFNRSNIFLEVRAKKNPEQQVTNFISDHRNQSGIIYCFSRKQVDSLTKHLQSLHFSVLPYHAGLRDDERAKNQELFIRGKIAIIVATLAFGMGINKPDVRYVIHFDIPKSIEQYYQEIGRAGRDGRPATALLLYGLGDIKKIRFFWQEKSSKETEKAEKLLQSMINYAESTGCRRKQMLSYFGDAESGQTQDSECCCDRCSAEPIPPVDMTIPVQKFLSCIIRTNQRYGAAYIIDILTGSQQKRIRENGHQQLSTWGIGRDLSRESWFTLANALIESGYLTKTADYGVLLITETAKDVLATRATVTLPINLTEDVEQTKITKSGRQLHRSSEELHPQDKTGAIILELLRDLRRQLAQDADVPPYVIFSDKTMEDIATKKPETTTALLDIYGIGSVKAERFGAAIITIVKIAAKKLKS